MIRAPSLRKTLVVALCSFAALGFYSLAFGAVVLNGTTSLPDTGYLMVRWPIVPVRGAYAAFEAPDTVAAGFQGYNFVKRIEGMPGDTVTVEGRYVCVHGVCHMTLAELDAAGFGPMESGILGPDDYLVFGDAANSLDSRYAVIGPIHRADIHAIGIPAPLPHWKEIHAWFAK